MLVVWLELFAARYRKRVSTFNIICVKVRWTVDLPQLRWLRVWHIQWTSYLRLNNLAVLSRSWCMMKDEPEIASKAEVDETRGSSLVKVVVSLFQRLL